jgi:hydrogenase maturation protease
MRIPLSGSQLAVFPSPFRVVGCGNVSASDDGLGIELVERLRREHPEKGPCNFSAIPSAGTELLDLLDSREPILFVDAVTGEFPPGTLHLIPLPSSSLNAKPVSSLSSHGWGLLETIELARRLKPALPPMFLLGIELGSVELFGPRTPAVERALQRVESGFSSLVRLLQNPASQLWDGPQRILPSERLPWEETCV